MCSICGHNTHAENDCIHRDEILEINHMAKLAGYYLELVTPDRNNEIYVTWRHNSHNPKNFCSGAKFLEMCKETLEWREEYHKKTGR